MSDTTKVSLAVLQRVSEFLAELPEDQLLDLAEGRARIAYVPTGSDTPAPAKKAVPKARAARQPPAPSTETLAQLEALGALPSREAGHEMLQPMKKTQLTALARALSVPGATSLGMGDLREAVVEGALGRGLDSVAIRSLEAVRS
jgi:hypothetical protein